MFLFLLQKRNFPISGGMVGDGMGWDGIVWGQMGWVACDTCGQQQQQ